MLHPILKTTCLIALLSLSPAIAKATSLDPFIAIAGAQFGGIKPKVTTTGLTAAVADIDPVFGPRGESANAYAAASLSGLSVSASSGVTSEADGNPARPFTGYAVARTQAFDLVFTDETGSGKSHTNVSLSFLLEGFISIDGIDSGNSFLSTVISINYGLGVAGPNSTAQPKSIGLLGFYDPFQSPQDNPNATAYGIFEGIDYKSSEALEQVFSVPTYSVPLDTIVSFQLSLSAGAGGTSNHGDALQTLVDFGNTLTFSPTSFFDLERGITANSASLGLVNNAAVSTPSTVPLPATLWLLPSAIFGMASVRFRKRRAATR